MTDSSLWEINDKIFEAQYTHCQLHHMGLVQVYQNCALCLVLHRLAELARAKARQGPGALAAVATQ
jgi:hypothetical protein